MPNKPIKLLVCLILLFALIVPFTTARVECNSRIVFAYFDPYNKGIASGPHSWEALLNAFYMPNDNPGIPTGIDDADFCAPGAITYILSHDYEHIKYMMTANGKYITFSWNGKEAIFLQKGFLREITDDFTGETIFPENMLNPDAMTTVAPVERGNYIFISQGNLLSSIGYRPDLTPQRPYHIFPHQNIAQHFNTFKQPVPQGFETFNAVAEAYLFSEGIVYFVVN